MLLARLAVENTTYRFDKPFTYIVPDTLAADVKRATELIAYCRERLYNVEADVKSQLEQE